MVPWNWGLPKTGQVFPEDRSVLESVVIPRNMMVAFKRCSKNVGHLYDRQARKAVRMGVLKGFVSARVMGVHGECPRVQVSPKSNSGTQSHSIC